MVSKNDRIWALYPEYFDAGRSRAEGRRVGRQLALSKVKSRELYTAALALDMGPVLEEKAHPSDWHRERGRVLVRKEFPKEETIRRLAAEMKRARGVNLRVTNNSWGGGGFSQALRDAIASLDEADVLFVAAAGNSSRDNDSRPTYPSSFEVPNVVAVAATGVALVVRR